MDLLVETSKNIHFQRFHDNKSKDPGLHPCGNHGRGCDHFAPRGPRRSGLSPGAQAVAGHGHEERPPVD